VIPTQEQPIAVPSLGVHAVAAAIPTNSGWDGPWPTRTLCFGSGLKSVCWTMLSVARTTELAGVTSWTPTHENALRMCIRYGLLPIKASSCAKKLVLRTLPMIWDTAIVRGVSDMGNCLLFKSSRHRTLRHPLAGVWGTPEYHPTYSYTSPYNPSTPHVTGWGRWSLGLTGKLKLPLICDSNRLVYGRPNTDTELE
jgi:hypothetical protein